MLYHTNLMKEEMKVDLYINQCVLLLSQQHRYRELNEFSWMEGRVSIGFLEGVVGVRSSSGLFSVMLLLGFLFMIFYQPVFSDLIGCHCYHFGYMLVEIFECTQKTVSCEQIVFLSECFMRSQTSQLKSHQLCCMTLATRSQISSSHFRKRKDFLHEPGDLWITSSILVIILGRKVFVLWCVLPL